MGNQSQVLLVRAVELSPEQVGQFAGFYKVEFNGRLKSRVLFIEDGDLGCKGSESRELFKRRVPTPLETTPVQLLRA